MPNATVYLSFKAAANAIRHYHLTNNVQPGTIYRRVARVIRNPDGTVDHGVSVLVKNRVGAVVGAL